MFKSLLVLESPWDRKSVRSKSVWPFVSEFARVYDIPAFFQGFSDKDSFQHWIRRFHKEKFSGPKLLYVAAHGSTGSIGGLLHDIYGKTIMESLKAARSIRYVHFGSCAFGSAEKLETLLNTAKGLVWAAGYEEDVDWVDSTLFDVMFWNRIAVRDRDSKGRHFQKLIGHFVEEVPGLASKLGFRFSYRRGRSIECPDFGARVP